MESFLELLFKPFYSKEYYYRVIKNWKGKNLLLLFLMTCIVLIPAIVKTTNEIEALVDAEAPFYIGQAPEIRIAKGTLTINKTLPYYVKNREGKIIIAFVDIPGDVYKGIPCLITKDKIIMQQSNNMQTTYDFKWFADIVLDKETLRGMAPNAKFMSLFFYPFMAVGLYLYHLFISLIVFAIGLIFIKRLHSTIGKESLYRATVVAMLPMMYCSAVLQFFDIATPPDFLFPMIMFSTVYLVYAIASHKILGQMETSGGNNPGDG